MSEYHKIQSVFRRYDWGGLIFGDWTWPEFAYLANLPWDATEKIDGTNIRVSLKAEPHDYRIRNVHIGGRTDRAQIPTFLYDRLVNMFGTGQQHYDSPWFNVFGWDDFRDMQDVTLYGEGFGARIQKGGGNYIPDGVDFCLFDVKVGDLWLRRGDVHDIAEKFGIPYAPLLMTTTLWDAIAYTREGFDSQWGPFPAEGLVLRPSVELRTRRGDRVITKVKTKDFR